MNRILCALVIAGSVISGIGCSSIVYINRDVKNVVAMVPFEMEAQEAGCGEKLLPYIETQLKNRGYTLVPRETLMQWYASKKYTLGDEASEWSTVELCKEFKVDAVVWANISRWGKTITGIYNNMGVTFHAELQDKDGGKIWEHDGAADSDSLSKSLFSMIADTLTMGLWNPEVYAGPAAEKCFNSLGHAGWDPKILKQREEEAKKVTPPPAPGR